MNIARLVAVAAWTTASAVACSGISQQRIGVAAPDSTEIGFGPVAEYLDRRCGTHDCHGQPARNLQIWGCNGMRLSPYAVTGCNLLAGGTKSTALEHQATFRSLVGLEPSVMTAVVQGGGANPELLTFVRKARGTEQHKGGALITAGDDQDICITSWLANATDTQACGNALGYPIFPAPDAPSE